MDNDDGPARTPPGPKDRSALPTGPGGTVEPVDRVAVAKARYQPLGDEPGDRYEMRDPLAEVTYRSHKLSDILLKAEQLGSNKFVAIDAGPPDHRAQGPQWLAPRSATRTSSGSGRTTGQGDRTASVCHASGACHRGPGCTCANMVTASEFSKVNCSA